MKKICIICCLMLAALLCGCNQTPQPNQEYRYTTVVFDIDCEEEIYGVTFEYCLDRQLMGGQSVSQDPEMAKQLPKNETQYIRFEEQGFFDPEALNTSKFGILVYVTLKNNATVAVEYLYEWSAEYGQEYHFTLSGNSTDGFVFEPAEKDISYTITPYSDLPEELLQ